MYSFSVSLGALAGYCSRKIDDFHIDPGHKEDYFRACEQNQHVF